MKSDPSYAVRSQHHANLRSLADFGAAFAMPRNADGLLVDKIEADDDPYATVACYFT